MKVVHLSNPEIVAHNEFYTQEDCQQLNDANALLMLTIGIADDKKIIICANPKAPKDYLINVLKEAIHVLQK